MARNRLSALLLSALMLLTLSSCGKQDPPEVSTPPPDQSEPAVSVIAPVEPEPEPEPELPYANPLTGEGCQNDMSRNRPIAIMLNNLKKALPQLGVSEADVIFEIPAEGGITRMLAVYQDIAGAGELGSVRSARDYYASIAYGMDAVYLHAGGSPQAYKFIKNYGVAALDCVNGPYEGTLYWRDKERRKNAGLEHSVLTSSAKIQELLPTYSHLRLEHKDGFEVGWQFWEDTPPAGGEAASKLTIPFSTYKTGVFTYDSESQRYLIEEYGKPYVDGNTGEQVGVSNVLVLYTDISIIPGDEAGRLKVRTTGTGDGLLLYQGQLRPITWKRDSDSARFSFYLENGQEAQLSVGNTYINIVKKGTDVTWE